MKRVRRRELETIGMSFLDAIFCGFGAILLLFIIARGAEPGLVERDAKALRAELRVLTEERAELADRRQSLESAIDARQAEVSKAQQMVARYQDELTTIEGRYRAARDTALVQNRISDQLARAQQTLTEEMKRLLAQRREAPPERERVVGGIPVDSEYIIFVIDTSGSMQSLAWPLMRRKVEETLKLYPRVKGIQVLSDMGQFMFSQYGQVDSRQPRPPPGHHRATARLEALQQQQPDRGHRGGNPRFLESGSQDQHLRIRRRVHRDVDRRRGAASRSTQPGGCRGQPARPHPRRGISDGVRAAGGIELHRGSLRDPHARARAPERRDVPGTEFSAAVTPAL